MIEKIANRVSNITGVSIEEMKSRSRKRKICLARQFVIYIAIEDYRMTHYDVSFYLNQRSRSDVSKQFRMLEWQMNRYTGLNNTLKQIRESII